MRISAQALNRATLGRQMLLQREALDVVASAVHQPNVKANASTPGSRNSISNRRSAMGCGCRIS